MPATLLVVERDLTAAHALAREIEEASPVDFRVVITPSVREALDALRSTGVDCLLVGDASAEADTLDCVRRVRDQDVRLPIIVVSSAGCEEVAVEAMKLGASDYVPRRNGFVPGLLLRVRQAIGRKRIEGILSVTAPLRSATRLSSELRERYAQAGIVGTCPALLESIALAQRAGGSDLPVVIEGETGTGKEVFAQAIHLLGRRARRPFLAQNCAAFADGVLESELFGHVRGAFTGASAARRGLFEAASGGTLFLDEVSELSAGIQAKLLRVLQEGEVRPLGSNETRRVDVRVVAASNRELRSEIERGRFRADLYHRLNVITLHLPPLRDRPGDVALLAQHFLTDLAGAAGSPIRGFTPSALRRLERYRWPGNVRELRNEIQRLILCADGRDLISAELLAPHVRAGDGGSAPRDGRPLKEILRDVEVATILTRLREHGYSRARTARSLGIARETLWAKLRQHGCELEARPHQMRPSLRERSPMP